MFSKISKFSFFQKNQVIFISLIFIFSSFAVAQATFELDDLQEGTAVCEEQLQYCIDEFNSLLSDFWNGTNCESDSFNYLKEKNWELTQARDDYKAETEMLRGYKYGFFVLMLVIVGLISFSNFRKNKTGRKKNAGTARKK